VAGETDSTDAIEWVPAAVRAAIILAASVVGFIAFPNWLVGYLSLRVIPTARDLLVGAWFVVALFLVGLVFVRAASER
jgi:Na+/pantothenate symporter